MIFNVIVSAARKIFGDLGPPVPQFLVSLNDKHIFLLSPLVLFDVRIEMIVPS
jgi:hypothetical protein